MAELKNYDTVQHDETKEIKEIIYGKIYYMAGGTFLHVDIITNIGLEFNIYFRNKNIKCKAYTEGLKVFLDKKRKDEYVLPDVSIICDRSKRTKQGTKAIPELIVEVISDSSRRDDKITKLNFYENSGIKEYWIVEPELKSIEQYILVNGRYEPPKMLVLLNENELNNLSDERKASYTTIIKPTMFEDLEIDLKDIFPQEE
ncbi:MAG: Uma2 family endonuclease [Oscillospiraceae bacterium]|nr:Uma2 family endonuclease [Oscillospiraceae bacterium]